MTYFLEAGSKAGSKTGSHDNEVLRIVCFQYLTEEAFLIRVCFIVILTWCTRARGLEAFVVSRMAVPGTSMCFGLGTSHFAFASVGRGARTFVSA